MNENNNNHNGEKITLADVLQNNDFAFWTKQTGSTGGMKSRVKHDHYACFNLNNHQFGIPREWTGTVDQPKKCENPKWRSQRTTTVTIDGETLVLLEIRPEPTDKHMWFQFHADENFAGISKHARYANPVVLNLCFSRQWELVDKHERDGHLFILMRAHDKSQRPLGFDNFMRELNDSGAIELMKKSLENKNDENENTTENENQ